MTIGYVNDETEKLKTNALENMLKRAAHCLDQKMTISEAAHQMEVDYVSAARYMDLVTYYRHKKIIESVPPQPEDEELGEDYVRRRTEDVT